MLRSVGKHAYPQCEANRQKASLSLSPPWLFPYHTASFRTVLCHTVSYCVRPYRAILYTVPCSTAVGVFQGIEGKLSVRPSRAPAQLTQGDTPAFSAADPPEVVVADDGILGVVQSEVPDDHLHLRGKGEIVNRPTRCARRHIGGNRATVTYRGKEKNGAGETISLFVFVPLLAERAPATSRRVVGGLIA